MGNLYDIILALGMIFISAYSMKVSQESIKAVNDMSHQVQMMFIKS